MGGEAAPLCSTQWPGYSQTAFLNYVQDMMRYESSLNPPMQILANIHFVDSNANTSYADAEAQYAVQFGFGFGNNRLQKSDIANYGANALCNADWCAMFNKYLSSTMSDGKPIQLELQTLGPPNRRESDWLVSGPAAVRRTAALQFAGIVAARPSARL